MFCLSASAISQRRRRLWDVSSVSVLHPIATIAISEASAECDEYGYIRNCIAVSASLMLPPLHAARYRRLDR